jgi:RES domain
LALSLPSVSPKKPIYRVARHPDPWTPPSWADVGEDGTFGNRFDDSAGIFRVLYAGSTPFTCFLETLARFRKPNSELLQQLDEIDGPSDFTGTGIVPGSWLTPRRIGSAALSGKRFAPVYTSEWIAHLRQIFEAEFIARGVIKPGKTDFDLAVMTSQYRPLTQRIATYVYESGYHGIQYSSRHGDDLVNWAIFEPFNLAQPEHSDLESDDPDFKRALQHFDLRFDPRL